MSDLTALIFLLMVAPVTAAAGYLFLGRPNQVFGLSARLSRWSLRVLGLKSSAVKWMFTPLHRRLFGDPATVLDRACENPSEFRTVIFLLRIQGVMLLLFSVVAATAGAISLGTE